MALLADLTDFVHDRRRQPHQIVVIDSPLRPALGSSSCEWLVGRRVSGEP